MNKRGIALIISFMVIAVLSILGGAIISRSVSESRIIQKYRESTQAFWLAEAGVNRALVELRNNYNVNGTCLWQVALGQGRYCVDVAPTGATGENRLVITHGCIPDVACNQARVERIIEVVMTKAIPPDFYGYAIYSAGSVDFNGSAYTVSNNEAPPENKAVLYADNYDVEHPEAIIGTVTHNASFSPLARLDFAQLRQMAVEQGNLYTAADLASKKPFPTSFYNAIGKPNIVYVEGDLTLNGNIGTIGGFYVVAGDVITSPDATQDAIINGNGQIDGLVYTRGLFRINGGGGGLNVNGGVWAGELARLNGNVQVTYGEDYMSAIRALNINVDVQIISWKDKQNPYLLTP